jgi:hypothetical protein
MGWQAATRHRANGQIQNDEFTAVHIRKALQPPTLRPLKSLIFCIYLKLGPIRTCAFFRKHADPYLHLGLASGAADDVDVEFLRVRIGVKRGARNDAWRTFYVGYCMVPLLACMPADN